MQGLQATRLSANAAQFSQTSTSTSSVDLPLLYKVQWQADRSILSQGLQPQRPFKGISWAVRSSAARYAINGASVPQSVSGGLQFLQQATEKQNIELYLPLRPLAGIDRQSAAATGALARVAASEQTVSALSVTLQDAHNKAYLKLPVSDAYGQAQSASTLLLPKLLKERRLLGLHARSSPTKAGSVVISGGLGGETPAMLSVVLAIVDRLLSWAAGKIWVICLGAANTFLSLTIEL